MSDRLQQLTLFVRAIEAGSFSKAARELGLSQPSVSRNIADLEERIGVKLLLRTTRKLMPTDAGRVFFKQARDILNGLDEAESAARGADSLSGVLRLALPVAFGTREITPLLRPFLDRHPALTIDMLMADRFDDLVAEGVDMALRLGRQPDSSFVARRLASARRLIVASPDYLARRGTPATPAELAQHDCLRGPSDPWTEGWSFKHGDTVTSIAVDGRIRVNAASGLIACAVEGLGLALVSLWMCRAELIAGTLVPVLNDYTLNPVDAYAVFPGGRQPSHKARALTEYLANALRSELE
ncbi:DNA-binding transcriptional LysR family regulator [Rhizobium sp. BK313]|jgi:DNA-binding transcriptional LysR family regulator|uniref:LysR family transcriptional regulator n=1 Tax=Rhizobium sp. BK313 TaxID=2587081 RepID=UPI001062054F|nr:LysR family transcriptional regulator [Rhizobium sp. BK313]MBB3458391.1 DNA-binding transcriptional LysR family regulator [Rhizobium sp. BK313]